MLMIGSYALKTVGIDLGRQPKDKDLICYWETFQNIVKNNKDKIKAYYPISDKTWVIKYNNGAITECEIAWEGSSGEQLIELTATNHVSTVDLVYTLKMSHRYLKDSPHFLKTMKDIHLLRSMDAKIPEELKDWFKIREKETYKYQHPKLNKNKSEFFDTVGVVYKYDHDSIHEAVKLYDKPAYTYFKPEEKEVWCDKVMFDSLDESLKLAAVFEESCVLAIERSLVPFNNWDKEQWAFDKALEKVCTSITSGWFREYAWENYSVVKFMKDACGESFLKERFNQGIQNQTIKENKTNDSTKY